MPKTKCEDESCGCEIDPNDMGDCDTCNLVLCGECVTKHFEKGHLATFRPRDDPTYRAENPFE